MAASDSSRRVGSAWPVLAGVAILAVLAGAGVYVLAPPSKSTATQTASLQTVPPAPATATAPVQQAARQRLPPAQTHSDPPAGPSTPAPLPAQAAPSFDVVRVGPRGDAVIAGRAQPGAEVILRDNGQELGQARADRRGEFVILPRTPLPEGGRELTLASREGTGPEVKSESSVVLVVPPQAPARAGTAPAMPPVALLIPEKAPPRLLQALPDARQMDKSEGAARLTLERVDYDERGEIRFTGSASPDAALRVYVDNGAIGDAAADPSGRWALTPRQPMAAGLHQLRVDQLATSGRVMARVELPFERTALPAAEIASERVVVQPGHTLWRIARQAYGSGVRYTHIYLANRDQIKDPHRIYPGQAFALPASTP